MSFVSEHWWMKAIDQMSFQLPLWLPKYRVSPNDVSSSHDHQGIKGVNWKYMPKIKWSNDVLRQSFKLWITCINDIKVKSFFWQIWNTQRMPASLWVDLKEGAAGCPFRIGSVDACAQCNIFEVWTMDCSTGRRKWKPGETRHDDPFLIFPFFSSFYPFHDWRKASKTTRILLISRLKRGWPTAKSLLWFVTFTMCQEVPVMKYSAKNVSILFGQTDNFVSNGDCFQQFWTWDLPYTVSRWNGKSLRI